MTDPIRAIERRLASAELANLRTAAAGLARRVDKLEAALNQAEDRAYNAEVMADTLNDALMQDTPYIDRAIRIADMAAEELIRSEGTPSYVSDEFMFALCQAEDHVRDCIDHICARGIAAQHETADGYIVVQIITEVCP